MRSIVVLVDTREHAGKNDHILNYFDNKKINWERRKLPFADYSFKIPKNEELGINRDLYFDKLICIERKNSLDEIAGNITKDRERLKREFTLAPSKKILLIENANFNDLIYGNYMSHYDPKSFSATLFSFWHEFDLPVIFIPDKKLTGWFILMYFTYYLRDMIK